MKSEIKETSSSLFSFELRVHSFTKLSRSSSSSSVVFLPQIIFRLFSYPKLVFDCVDDGVLDLLRREIDADILALALDEEHFRHNVDETVLQTLNKVSLALGFFFCNVFVLYACFHTP